jgi:transposase
MWFDRKMRPIYARAITKEERQALRKELKSDTGVVVRRSQVILMSADEDLKAQAIAERVGYSDETVRQVIQGFNQEGVQAVHPKSRARPDDQRAFKDAAREGLKAIVHQSPRAFGCESSMWTLQLLAEVSYQERLTDRLVHSDTVGETLHQLGVNWKKAKRHIQSPDAHYLLKKNDAIG